METPVDAPQLARLLLQTLDELATCLVVLTRDRRIIAMNAAAAHLVRQRNDIATANCAFRLTHNDDDLALARGVAEVAHGSERVVIVSDRGPGTLCVTIRPLSELDDAVLLHIANPLHQPPCNRDALLRLFPLSPAESRVAAEAVEGATATEIARSLSLSVHTVRSHLKSIFAKTGATTRGELVRLLAGAASALRPLG